MFWRRKSKPAELGSSAKPVKPQVVLKPESARFAVPGEKIIEFRCNDLAGLLSIRQKPDGGAIAEFFACDSGFELRFNRDSTHSGGLS